MFQDGSDGGPTRLPATLCALPGSDAPGEGRARFGGALRGGSPAPSVRGLAGLPPAGLAAAARPTKFLLDIIEMERNDLWLNVKGNYIFFKGKIILN